MADPNGSNVQQVCTTPAYPAQFNGIKAGINNKIYYAYYENNIYKLYSVNTDGTGGGLMYSGNEPISEIAPDGVHGAYFYYDTMVVRNISGPLIRHKIPLGSFSNSYWNQPSFSYDSHKVAASYVQSDTLMLKVFDITTATAITRSVTVIPNSGGNGESRAYMASDGDRIVITVRIPYTISCYIYRLSTSTLINSFALSNDMGIQGVYAF